MQEEQPPQRATVEPWEPTVRFLLHNEIEPALTELNNAIRILPPVDANGHSECPYAGQFYSQLERAADKVAQVLEQIRPRFSKIDESLKWHQERVREIEEHAGDLQDDRTKAKYQGALWEARADMNRVLQDHQLLKDAIARMEQALRHATRLLRWWHVHQGAKQSPPSGKVDAAASISAAGRGIISMDAQPER